MARFAVISCGMAGVARQVPLPTFQGTRIFTRVIALDWMHCKYLGHDQLCYESVLSLLTKHILPGDPSENIRQIWNDICYFYKEQSVPCRFRYLNRVSMFERKSPQYPKLRGKAAEIKYLCGPLLSVWQKYMNRRLKVHREIELYLTMNRDLEEILIVNRRELALPEVPKNLNICVLACSCCCQT